MRTVLITGGAGFIGSHLCEFLIEKGNRVICVDNLITGRTSNLDKITNSDNFEFIKHDITQPFFYNGDIDFIYHMASPASPEDYLEHSIHTLKVGALGTHNILGLAKLKGSKFLLASTSEIYGDPKINPQTEEYWGNVNPIGPRSVYDESKRFAEAITMAYNRCHNVDTRIARIFNTYGPRMRVNDGRVVPNFINQALKNEPFTIFGTGMQTRSFCYVSDLVKGLYSLMMSEYHLPVNIGNPYEITILEFAQRVKEICNSNSEIRYMPLPEDDPIKRKPDITKAETILRWHPDVSLNEGLKETVDFFNIR